MKSTITGRALLALVAATAVTLLVAAPASAAKLGSSTLKQNRATFEALSDFGVTTKVTGSAKLTGQGIKFPVTGGTVDPETGKAKFVHTGGLKFTYNGMSLKVQNFIAKVVSKNAIKAEVPREGKLRLADLNVKKLDILQKGRKFTYSNIKVLIAKKAAKALTAELGLPDLTGTKLGKLTTKFNSPSN